MASEPELSGAPEPEGRGLDLADDAWIPEDRPALRGAMETLKRHRGDERAEGELRGRIPAGIFENIQGHDEVKRVLRHALDAPKPGPVLLVGPPGTAKTEFLLDMKRLWGSHYATGAAISQAGIVQFLVQRPQATRLLVDDLDKADPSDLWALLELMQSGAVTRMQHDRQEHVERKGLRVFAAANSAEKLPEPLLSRFAVLAIQPYTPEEFHAVATRVLQQREGLKPARAAAIADAVGARSQSIRDAVQVGRLAGEYSEIQPIIDQVIPAARR